MYELTEKGEELQNTLLAKEQKDLTKIERSRIEALFLIAMKGEISLGTSHTGARPIAIRRKIAEKETDFLLRNKYITEA